MKKPIEEVMRRGPEPEEAGPLSDGGLTGDVNAVTGRDLPKPLDKDDDGKGGK